MFEKESDMICPGKLIIVVGLQFGSEGKGAITEYYAPILSAGVRVGGANAGHTVYFNDKKYVMRQLPSIWMNPVAKLFIGRAAIINLDVLLQEIEIIDALVPIKHRLFIDGEAFVVTDEDKVFESQFELAACISSTSSKANLGIGGAQASKVLRLPHCKKVKDCEELQPFVHDTSKKIYDLLQRGEYVLLEGTQGHGLSIDFGYFPFTTSRDTTTSTLAGSIGIPLNKTNVFETHIIGVMRTYPIRVGGNSGPFHPDSKEVGWNYVSTIASQFLPKSVRIEERTSVTNTLRRVATFSFEQIKDAVRINGVAELAVTFGDYLDFRYHESETVCPLLERFIDEVESRTGVNVGLVKTGPTTTIDFDHYRRTMHRKCHW